MSAQQDNTGMTAGAKASGDRISMEQVEQSVISATLTHTLLNASHEAIILLHHNKVVECNEGSVKLFSYPRPELMGSSHEKLSPEFQPDGRPSAEAGTEYQQKALAGEYQEFDWTYRNLEGEALPCKVSFTPISFDVEPHIMAVVRDLRPQLECSMELDQKTAELQLRNEKLDEFKSIIIESRNKLKGVFDTLEEPILSVTRDFIVESMNLAASELSGRHPREHVGKSLEQYLKACSLSHELTQTVDRGFRAMLAQGNRQWFQVELPESENYSCYEINLTPVHDESGRFMLGIVHIKDVTTFKRMERTIREHSHELEAKVVERTSELSEANQELRQLDQLRRDLTDMVVHDMKGPLAEVIGNLDLVLRQSHDPGKLELLHMAMVGANDLLRMITNLLDIGRMEDDRLPVVKADIDFTALTEKMISRFSTMVNLKGLEVSVEDLGAGPFRSDPDILERVLQNLFTNALNHTELGNIWIRIKPGPIEEGGVLISLQDTGCGIPKEKHSEIFKKFTQAGQTPIRTSTGLGLTFCSLAVQALEGRIWLESEVDQGSTFYVWLPGY